jgi:hypothetical protein
MRSSRKGLLEPKRTADPSASLGMTKERVTFVGKWFLNRKSLGLAANLYETNALSFVIPSVPGFPATQRSTWPRVRLFVKESRMKIANATKLNRKSGVAQWRGPWFLLPFTQMLGVAKEGFEAVIHVLLNVAVEEG